MRKRKILTLLFMAVATTAFAAEDRMEVASIDKASTPRQYHPPKVIERNEYYEIRGSSEKDLRKSMCQNGCTWDDGKTYDSVTSWSWSWDYGSDRASQTCSTDNFAVTIEITSRYPKWVRTGEAPQPLVEKWDDYMKNLVMHENVHRDKVLDVGAEFSAAVARLPRTLSCADLDRQVQALSSELMAQLNAAQREYDADTNHGAKQGAFFP